MSSSLAIILFIVLFSFHVVAQAASDDESPFSFIDNIAEDFFDENDDIEASGVDIAPDGSHLVIVTDEGEIIFINLLDYESGHCMVDLYDEVDGTDLEGVAIDPTEWSPSNMNVYVVHEGADDDEPYLYKINYEYDPDAGRCSATVVESKSLYSAIPCLETSNGIESLGLKSASTSTDPAVFLVGIQDTGKVYEVTAEGASNGSYCYDGTGGTGYDDISATAYNREYGHIWSYIESEDTIAVVDTTRNCPVAMHEMPSSRLDEEGLAIDFENGRMYVVVDGQGDGSVVSVYNFTYPEHVDECLEDIGEYEPRSCSNFAVCGADKRKGLRRGNKLFH